MILPDANLLLHAYNNRAPEHERSRAWWEQVVNGEEAIGIAWVVILAFIRVSTKPPVFQPPLTVEEATGVVREWLSSPNVKIIAPGGEHAELMFELLKEVGTAGNLTTDAHLATLAIEYQAEIATVDGDFARFPRVRWFNPIYSSKR